MKKLIFIILVGLIGFSLVAQGLFASEERTQPHKFVAYTADTSVAQSKTIFRITGVVTGASGSFGIYNSTTIEGATNSNIAVEGGEASSGDALPVYDFGPDGLILDAGSSVVVNTCTVVIEYI